MGLQRVGHHRATFTFTFGAAEIYKNNPHTRARPFCHSLNTQWEVLRLKHEWGVPGVLTHTDLCPGAMVIKHSATG